MLLSLLSLHSLSGVLHMLHASYCTAACAALAHTPSGPKEQPVRSQITPRLAHGRCCCVLRPPRVAEGRLFEYNLRRADCLAGVFPPLPTNATTSLGALRPPAPGATSCQEGVGAGAAARNGSALVSASTAAAALAAVRAASALSFELWLRPSAADLASPEPRPILALARGDAGGGLQPSGCFDGQYALLLAQAGPGLGLGLARAQG